jgi:hypothetical protein
MAKIKGARAQLISKSKPTAYLQQILALARVRFGLPGPGKPYPYQSTNKR